MALADQLRPASWRGVPFFVDAGSISAGRRSEVHAYPKRDKHYVEDLGKDAREYSVRGFLVGTDYIQQAIRLLDAMEEEGGGTLVHPWHGSLKVKLKDKGSIEYNESLGRATVDMLFIEDGELAYPSAGVATGAKSRLAADGLGSAISLDFAKKFSINGLPDFIGKAARGDLGNVFSLVGGNPLTGLTSLGGVSGLLGGGGLPGLSALGFLGRAPGALTSAFSMLGNPLGLAGTMLGFFSAAKSRMPTTSIAPTTSALVRGTRDVRLQPAPSAPIATPLRQRQAGNTEAIYSLTRTGLLVQAIGLSSLMPTTVHDDAVAVRDGLTGAIDAEAMTASDEVFEALQIARAAVWQDLTERTRDSARLDSLTPLAAIPALVLAYNLYEDAGRSGEIVERNSVRHPGFLPAEPLRVLSR